MRLIVDSGSTKTDWIAIDENGSILFETFTLGLNPQVLTCLLYTSPSPRDVEESRMPSSA